MSVPFYEKDREEKRYYEIAKPNEKVLVPVTRQGFEALLERALKIYDLPCDDSARQVLCGIIHHIDRSENTLTINQVTAALHKQLSNGLTSVIYDEIKIKREAEARDAKLASVASIVQSETVSTEPSAPATA